MIRHVSAIVLTNQTLSKYPSFISILMECLRIDPDWEVRTQIAKALLNSCFSFTPDLLDELEYLFILESDP